MGARGWLLRGGVPSGRDRSRHCQPRARHASLLHLASAARSIAGIGALPYGAKWLLNGEVRFCLRAALARGAGG